MRTPLAVQPRQLPTPDVAGRVQVRLACLDFPLTPRLRVQAGRDAVLAGCVRWPSVRSARRSGLLDEDGVGRGRLR